MYNLGDGSDCIDDLGGNDVIQFGNDIALNSLGFMRDDNDNMHIRLSDGNEIMILGQYANDGRGIESIRLSDNTVISNINSLTNQIGSSENNIVLPAGYTEAHLCGDRNLNAEGNALNNFMRGNAGNNILEGKAGDDTYWEIEGGNDTYIYNIGDGNDFIDDWSGNDSIVFGQGITTSNIQFAYQNGNNNLEITFANISGSIVIADYFDPNQTKQIENFVFADNTVLTDISSYLCGDPLEDEYEDEEPPTLLPQQNNNNNNDESGYDVNMLIQEMNSYGADNDGIMTNTEEQNNEDLLLVMGS